jgi:diguanylate cyclase (GGDEF)-like protein
MTGHARAERRTDSAAARRATDAPERVEDAPVSESSPEDHGPVRAAIERSTPTLRVLLFALVLALGGSALLLVTPSVSVAPDREWSLPFFTLLMGFAIAEAAALHVEIRKESHSLSLACVPMMFGLLYTSPLLLLVAYMVGGGSSLLWIRKSSPLKVYWNVSLFIAQVGLAGLIIRTMLGVRLPANVVEWAIPLMAVVAAELLSLVAVPLVIMAVDAKFRPQLFANVGQSQILAVLGGTFAVTALAVSLSSPYMAIYAFVPLLTVGLLLRSTGRLTQRFRDLQQLHRFTRALSNERGARTLDTGLVELVQILRTRSAGLMLIGHGEDNESTLRLLVDDTFVDLQPGPLSDLLVAVMADRSVVQLDSGATEPDVCELLAKLDAGRMLVAPVLREVDRVGFLFVIDRLGMRSEFTAEELGLFVSLANTLSSRLSNDLLVEKLEVQARNDALTGLPNRLSFEIAITSSLARPGTTGTVVMIDLDRFKDINDSLGHETGDRLLIEVADRLRATVRSTDLVSRFGGDEFAVLLVGSVDEGPVDLSRRVEEIHRLVTSKVELDGITFEVGASFGVVQWPAQGTDSATLLRRADAAMYEAKRNQLGVVWYTPELDADAPRRLDLYLSISGALEREELTVHFQPKVSLVDGRITGAEALVRWMHPAHGMIPPTEFIPLVVQTGLVGKLTRLVLRRSAEAVAFMRSAGLDISVAVNLTPRDLLDPMLVPDLRDIVETAGIEASWLHVEITENAMVVDFDTSISVLMHLRELGTKVAIDDFGTGYSSLQHLHRLPVDQLKIDQSFISRLATDDSAAAIVLASINLASDLGLQTVAEGIEDADTIGVLGRLGCDEIQGYYVSRPVPLHDFVMWVRQWDPAVVLDLVGPRSVDAASAVHPSRQPLAGLLASRSS